MSAHDHIRTVLDKTAAAEKIVAKIPGLNEVAFAPELLTAVGHYANDVAEGKKPMHVIERQLAERGGQIAVSIIPTGTFVLSATGLKKPLEEAATRVILAHNRFMEFDGKNAWHALTTGEVKYKDGHKGVKAYDEWRAKKGHVAQPYIDSAAPARPIPITAPETQLAYQA